MGYMFTGVEKLLQETFLPCLSFKKPKYLPPIVGTLSKMKVNKSGLCLQNPVTSADEKFLILQRADTELIRAIMGERKFSNTHHLQAVKEESSEGKKSPG